MDIRAFTVGPVQENCYVARRDGADRALVVDPGEEADRILAAIDALGVGVDAILLTHTHFDHIGAVAPVARATGAPVYCPLLEVDVLRNVNDHVPWPGLGPYEDHDPEQTVAGGERLALAGFEIEVVFTPGHSVGHVTYAVADGGSPGGAGGSGAGAAGGSAPDAPIALFSGDVLFAGSVGRVDLPGGDWPTLAASIESLLDAYPDETVVYPGHMGATTLGRERATNPFLSELAQQR